MCFPFFEEPLPLPSYASAPLTRYGPPPICGVGLSSVQVPPSHHRSSLAPPPPPPGWVMHCAVWVSSMLCPPSSQVMESPPTLSALVPGLLVGWLLVFGLLGWLLGWLVGCWTAEFRWLVGWLVGWLRGWLVDG